jgi:hypothetical protein
VVSEAGWMRTLVRAHNEVPCITANYKPKFPEEETCTLAQIEKHEINPALPTVNDAGSNYLALSGAAFRTSPAGDGLVRPL